MLAGMQIDGEWPGPVRLRRGWGRATARRWNPLMAAASLRLIRGNSAFLSEATGWVVERIGGSVLSPALYPSSRRVWERSGYQEVLRLDIMEKALNPTGPADGGVIEVGDPDLEEMEHLDRDAFDAFWHMGAAGLAEAMSATPVSTALQIRDGEGLVGYAILGAQLGVCFLQRIAVAPRSMGVGLGGSLVSAGEAWAYQRGCRVMVLNVRPDNERALSLYARVGFAKTPQQLVVLGFEP